MPRRVVLLFDSDTAGMAAANRALEVCLSQHLDIKLAFVPQGKDPCDFVLTAGKEGLDQVIAQATDVLQYKWDRLRETFAADDTLASRKGAVEEFLQAVAIGFGSNNLPVLESGLIVNKLAKMIGLPEAEIRKELDRRIKPPSEPVRTDGRTQDGLPTTDWGQGLYAACPAGDPGGPAQRTRSLPQRRAGRLAGSLRCAGLAQIASILLDVIRSEEDFSLSRVLARAESVEIGERIVELQRVGEEKGNYHFAPGRCPGRACAAQGHRGDVRTNAAVPGCGFRVAGRGTSGPAATRTASGSRKGRTSLNPGRMNNYVKRAVQQVNP